MNLLYETLRSSINKRLHAHGVKCRIMLLNKAASDAHVVSAHDTGEIPDEYHYVRFEDSISLKHQRTFVLPSLITHDVKQYFDRITAKVLGTSIPMNETLIIYTKQHFSLNSELNTIYIQDHQTLEQIIKNESGSNVFVASIVNEELIAFGYHTDGEGTIEIIPSSKFPEWLKIIKAKNDMIQNPMNEKYWKEVSYYTNPPEPKYYWGSHLFISPGINRCMIKINDMIWLDVDLDVLITTSHYYPKEIQQELTVWQSIY